MTPFQIMHRSSKKCLGVKSNVTSQQGRSFFGGLGKGLSAIAKGVFGGKEIGEPTELQTCDKNESGTQFYLTIAATDPKLDVRNKIL